MNEQHYRPSLAEVRREIAVMKREAAKLDKAWTAYQERRWREQQDEEWNALKLKIKAWFVKVLMPWRAWNRSGGKRRGRRC